MLKTIRKKILAIPCINKRVQALGNEREAKRIEQEQRLITDQIEQYHHRWSLIMSGAMRSVQEERVVVVSHVNGRVGGPEHAGPVFIDSVEWGVG